MDSFIHKVLEKRDGEIIGIDFYNVKGDCILSIIKPMPKAMLQMNVARTIKNNADDAAEVDRITTAIFGESKLAACMDALNNLTNYRWEKVCQLTYAEEKTLFFEVCKLPYKKAEVKKWK